MTAVRGRGIGMRNESEAVSAGAVNAYTEWEAAVVYASDKSAHAHNIITAVARGSRRDSYGSCPTLGDYDALLATSSALLAALKQAEKERDGFSGALMRVSEQLAAERADHYDALARSAALEEALRAAPDWPATDKEYGAWLPRARRTLRNADEEETT